MSKKTVKSYGSWLSPISASIVANAGTGLDMLLREIFIEDGYTYWIEPRSHEGGRQVIMRLSPDGTKVDVTPKGYNARTRVHEYGGGDYCQFGSTTFFSNFEDQRLYRQDSDQTLRPITPEPKVVSGLRYADGRVTPDGRWILCVHERHEQNGLVVNELVAIPTDGSSDPQTIVRGHDFYSSPRVSPDGKMVAWLAWNHPQMPWDGTELFTGELLPEGRIQNPRLVAGGPVESICQPKWSPDGMLHFISDRTNWWNLYREVDDQIIPVARIEAELGLPHWMFGNSRYAFLEDGSIACVYVQRGLDHLGIIEAGSDRIERLDVDFTFIRYLTGDDEGNLWFIGGNFQQLPSLVRFTPADQSTEIIHRNFDHSIPLDDLSKPRPIEFTTEDGTIAHALFFPPSNRNYTGPSDERPPLIVVSHGGPTSAAKTYLQFEWQYWTSRGFALADVNYGGSTGYGRSYRERLKGTWGELEPLDCIHAARYLIDEGQVDGNRLIIRGGSAGGWTTLCVLTFHDFFTAGVSYYGVADAEALMKFTHKFEERYLDSLLGPYPERKELYTARSPIHHTHQLSCPVILFQGLDDKIVPPSQSEMMVHALESNNIPHAYIAFEGEAHGFRRADTIQRALEAELSFFSQIYGIKLEEKVPHLTIINL